MGMLKTVRGGARARTSAQLQDYLAWGDRAGLAMQDYLTHGHNASRNRARAFRCSDSLPMGCLDSWARIMEVTRRSWGKDGGRRHYHWVVSPDPEDKVSAEECADVAAEWVGRLYPGHEWIVVVHDDNRRHITHAHVVANSVSFETGRKIQRSDRDVAREWDVLQEVCSEHGLKDLPEVAAYRQQRARREAALRTSAAERGMRARGARSWVADIREAVDAAVRESHSFDEFLGALAREGVVVTRESPRRGSGLVYRHPGGSEHELRVRAWRLGDAYTEEGIRARLGSDFDGVWGGPARVDPEPGVALQRAAYERASAFRAPGRPRTLTLEEAVLRARSRSATLRAISDSLIAVAELRSGGISTRGELDLARRNSASEVARLEEAARDVGCAVDRAAEVLSRAREAEVLRWRLAELDGRSRGLRSLDPSLRRERKGLRAKLEEDERDVAEGLKSAREFVAAAGLEGASDAAKAEALLSMCRVRAGELAEQCRAARASLQRLSRAGAAVDRACAGVVGERPERRRKPPAAGSGARQPELKGPRRASGPSWGSRAAGEVMRRACEERRIADELSSERARLAAMTGPSAASAGPTARGKRLSAGAVRRQQ